MLKTQENDYNTSPFFIINFTRQSTWALSACVCQLNTIVGSVPTNPLTNPEHTQLKVTSHPPTYNDRLTSS